MDRHSGGSIAVPEREGGPPQRWKGKYMNNQYTGYNPRLTERAKSLRKTSTPQEKHLWYDFLSKYPVKFYRQRSIACYIADFYCSKAKLVVELDGSQHYTDEGMSYDDARTEIINQFGVAVIRFSNYEVDNNFEGVCYEIDRVVKERLSC